MKDGLITVEFEVNGNNYRVQVLPHKMLADVLREHLGLTGTKIGCNEAECGACTVIVDDQTVLSCTYPILKAHGKKILTIEGLSRISGNNLHPLQEAFVLHGAVQCGFCIPGQIMTAYGLLLKHPDPKSDDVRKALKDTLCRCGGYPSIIGAIMAAASAIRTKKPVEPPDVNNSKFLFDVVGHIYPRPDAIDKVIGKAKYTDDIHFEGMLFGRTKRAYIPHGIIKKIDIQKAVSYPGVKAVLTADDIPGEHNHGLVIPDWPVLVGTGERIRYVGDAVAIVAAESREIADQALGLIEVEYEIRPVIGSPEEALAPEAEQLHANGNLLKHIKVNKGDVHEGFKQAEIVLERTFQTVTTDHAFIEPECSVARITENGRLEIFVGSQIPYADRSQVAKVLGLPEEKIRITGMLIGGGFGGKEDITGQIHAALLSVKTGKPVKILYDRHESLIVHPKRHATTIRVKIGAKKDGQLTAVQTELLGDTGAYASLGEKVLTRATTHSSGPYEVPHVKADCFAMYTNNPPSGAFRGFGVTQSAFAVESMMDILAETLDSSPIELRRKNGLRVNSVTNTGQVLRDSVGLLECIDRVQAELTRLEGDHPFKPNIIEKGKKVKAWGFATGYKNTGLGGGAPDKSSAEVEIYPDGQAEVRTSAAEIGQGLVTVLQLIAAEELGMKVERVRVLLSDTDLTPDAGPTTASRQTYVTGNAVRNAARVLRMAVANFLAEKLDFPPEGIKFEEGLAKMPGMEISVGEAASDMMQAGQKPKALYEYWAPATKPLGKGGDMHFAFGYSAMAAEVEVDCLTGIVKVLRIIAANDVGTAINPLGLKGQVEGGIMMGLGNALTEHFIVEDGRVITDRLARYRIPSIEHTPEIISIVVEDPTSEGPYGAKGIGELVSIPVTPAITNAIYNAVGYRVDKLPVDQEKIALYLRDKEKANDH